MSGLVLRWRVPAPRITLRWRGPQGMADTLRRRPLAPLAGFIVPAAVLGVSEGDGIDIVGSEIRLDINSLPSAP